MTKGQFRWLITASIVASILGIMTDFIMEASLPESLRDYLNAQSEADLTTRDAIVAVVSLLFLVAWVVAIIGLYCFWQFARPLMVIVLIGSIIISVVIGPTVQSGLTTAFAVVDTLLSGMILALIYTTPVRTWFEKPEVNGFEPAR